MSHQYNNWVAQQLEPNQRPANQGGMPRTSGGVYLYDQEKQRQDEIEKWQNKEYCDRVEREYLLKHGIDF